MLEGVKGLHLLDAAADGLGFGVGRFAAFEQGVDDRAEVLLFALAAGVGVAWAFLDAASVVELAVFADDHDVGRGLGAVLVGDFVFRVFHNGVVDVVLFDVGFD